MRQLLYVSNMSPDVTERDLEAILAVSRRNNGMLGISGILLHMDGGFLQLLEGEELPLHETYSRIRADRRHGDLRLLLDRAGAPSFAGWSMGFERLRADDPRTAGLLGIAREARTNRLAPGTGKLIVTLLESFCRAEPIQAAKPARAR